MPFKIRHIDTQFKTNHVKQCFVFERSYLSRIYDVEDELIDSFNKPSFFLFDIIFYVEYFVKSLTYAHVAILHTTLQKNLSARNKLNCIRKSTHRQGSYSFLVF